MQQFGNADAIGIAGESKIAITGITGDIGSGLTRYLLNKDCVVTGLVRRETVKKDQWYFDSKNEKFSYHEGDIFSKSSLEEMLNNNDVIYHLAAAVGQDISEDKEPEVLAVNAFGTALLAWLAKKSCRAPTIVYSSSQRVYGIENKPEVARWIDNVSDEFYREGESICALSDEELREEMKIFCRDILIKFPLPENVSIYDISKLLGEKFLEGIPNVVITRISNVYGPGDHSNRLVHRLVKNRFNGGTIKEKNEKRDYIYEDDVNKILYELGRKEPLSSDIVDIASGAMVSLSDFWEVIERFTPEKTGRVEFISSDLVSARQNKSFSETLLGRTLTGIETGLRNVIDEFKYNEKSRWEHETGTIVFDIGGTSIRVGIFYADGVLEIVSKHDSPNYIRNKDLNIQELQSELISCIRSGVEKAKQVAETVGVKLDKVGISFPGPVIDFATVNRAATLWGDKELEINLAEKVKEGLPGIKDVYILHDTSADAVRYAKEKNKENFCVITISSGISFRIYDRQRGGLITDKDDLTGEIGHLKIDYSDTAPLCECGDRGHLIALASGRAAERILREEAIKAPIDFMGSLLFEYTGGNTEDLNNALFDQALTNGDQWALSILKKLTRPVAHAINEISTISGVQDFYLVGGFVVGKDEVYLNAVMEDLHELTLLNRPSSYFDGHIELGYSDDADGMRGVGYFVQEQEGERSVQVEGARVTGYVRKDTDESGKEAIEAFAPTQIRYKNYFTNGVFEEDNPILKDLCESRKVLMVVDEAFYELWGHQIENYIAANDLNCIVYPIPGGEKVKDMKYVEDIYLKAKSCGLDRKAKIVAVGGGAVMDVAGLVAQLYRRKIDYIRIPTTLLGIIDAAVGVKVGVNYEGSKNFLGAFYPATAVISDTSFLETLPEREIRSGIAEIIKVGLISNAKLFEELEENGEKLASNTKFENYQQFIEDATVELLLHLQKDFYEYDLMRHVDFGHAMAHHFESLTDYELTHGEAVGIDMLISAHIAKERGILLEVDFKRIVSLYKKVGLPFYHPALNLDALCDGIKEAIAHKGGRLMMVIPKKIGQTVFIDSISKEELAGALKFLEETNEQDFLEDKDISQITKLNTYLAAFNSEEQMIEDQEEIAETLNLLAKGPIQKIISTIRNKLLPDERKLRAQKVIRGLNFEVDVFANKIIIGERLVFEFGEDQTYHPTETVRENSIEEVASTIKDKKVYIFDLEGPIVEIADGIVKPEMVNALIELLKTGKILAFNVLRNFDPVDFENIREGRDIGILKNLFQHEDFKEDMFSKIIMYGPAASRKFTFKKADGKTICEEDADFHIRFGKKKTIIPETNTAYKGFYRMMYKVEREHAEALDLDERHITYSDWMRYKIRTDWLGITYFPNETDKTCENWKLRILSRALTEQYKKERSTDPAFSDLGCRIIKGHGLIFVKECNYNTDTIQDIINNGFEIEDIVYFADEIFPKGINSTILATGVTSISTRDHMRGLSGKENLFQVDETLPSTEKTLKILNCANTSKKLKRDILYDVESTIVLFIDSLYAQFHENRAYYVRYDIFRLSPSQVEIIETYIDLLEKKVNIKRRPFSSKEGSEETLIAVYCEGKDLTGRDLKGEGHVDVSIQEGKLEEYILRITGMVNIALAVASVPDNVTEKELDEKYGHIIGFIQERYKDIVGRALDIPRSLEGILEAIRLVKLILPKAYRLPDRIKEYNRLARKALIAA